MARRVEGESRFDDVARVLYSTDASNRQVEPLGVVWPRHEAALQAAIEVAGEVGVPLIARGAGPGLVGAALGAGLIVDTSRHLGRVLGINLEARTVTVEPAALLETVDQAVLIEEFMTQPDGDGGPPITRLGLAKGGPNVSLHGHCHVKRLVGSGPLLDMLRGAGAKVEEIDAGCCGMAGSFGYEREHYELARRVGELALLPAVRRAAASGREVVAAGMSCRSQIRDGTGIQARHPIEVLAALLEPGQGAE